MIAQQLVPGVDGVTRWPASEIMIATDAVRALIRKGDDHQLRSQISVGRAEGMMTMEQSLAELGARRPHLARDGVRALLPAPTICSGILGNGEDVSLRETRSLFGDLDHHHTVRGHLDGVLIGDFAEVLVLPKVPHFV